MDRPTAADSKETKIVFGIDFGTTFSGVAWALSWEPDTIQVITEWGYHDGNSDTHKIPSLISYGQNGTVNWGYRVSSRDDPISWFKLLLLDEAELPQHLKNSQKLQQARQKVAELNKTAVQVVADYLRRLWQRAIQEVENAVDVERVLKLHPYHVVVTVPAIWKLAARDKMEQAVRLAGILETRSAGPTQLSLVSEPEAAAFATIRDNKNRIDLQIGDTFVVCDAGGGTADVISYSITETGEDLRFQECVAGDGALAGAATLDEKFENLLKRKVTPRIWHRADSDRINRLLKTSWERGIKVQFQNEADPWEVEELPSQWEQALGQDKITLEGSLVKGIFDATMTKIENIVAKQYRLVEAKTGKNAKYLILVGGFGRCPYLKKRLDLERPGQTTTIQSSGSRHQPWTAICRGAVWKGLGNDVERRISRAHYGTHFQSPFDPEKHEEWQKQSCPITNRLLAIGQMEWLLTYGTETGKNAPKRINYFLPYDFCDPPPDYPNFSIDLYTSDKPDSPSFDDSTLLCNLKCRSVIPFEDLVICIERPNYFRKLLFDLELTTHGNSIEFNVYQDGYHRLATQSIVLGPEDRNTNTRLQGPRRTSSPAAVQRNVPRRGGAELQGDNLWQQEPQQLSSRLHSQSYVHELEHRLSNLSPSSNRLASLNANASSSRSSLDMPAARPRTAGQGLLVPGASSISGPHHSRSNASLRRQRQNRAGPASEGSSDNRTTG